MGTGKISDVTSFFNVSAGNADMPGKTGADGNLFAQAMSDAAGRGARSMAAKAGDGMVKQARPDEAAQRMRKNTQTSDRLTEKADKNNDPAAKTVSKEKAGKKLDDLSGKIKDAIKNELAVDDEQLEQAMSVLGLTAMDLLDAGNIKDLMLELSGEQDAMALITNEGLLNSIGNVTELLEVSMEELTEEFGITAEQLAEMVNAADDDETEASGITVRQEDQAAGSGTVSPTEASLKRQEAAQSKDSSAEDGMQNAMQGQQDIQQPAVNETAAVPETEYRSAYVDREDILRQVTDSIKLNINQDSASMELQLHPASLGTVNLQINSNGGVITANLQVQNENVKSVLESQLVQLLETFEEQGQKVEAIEVSVAGYDLDRSLNQDNSSQDGERREGTAQGVSRTSRRRINLNELDEEDIEELTEEEQLAAEMLAMNGGNVDFLA